MPSAAQNEPVYRTIRYGDIDVYFTNELMGGGSKFGQDYLRVVPLLPQRPGTVFEWCSGPAFIAFSLLAHGMCDRLCLADINPLAVAACRKTVEMNNLQDRVSVYHSNSLDSIPAHEKWDLVVANPPHSGTAIAIPEWGDNILVYMDPGWALHRRFYRDVGKFLNPDGVVLIQENARFSGAEDFAPMIAESGLQLAHVSPEIFFLQNKVHEIYIYYIASTRGTPLPDGLDLAGTMLGRAIAC